MSIFSTGTWQYHHIIGFGLQEFTGAEWLLRGNESPPKREFSYSPGMSWIDCRQTWYWVASQEWISGKSRIAAADGVVIDDLAASVLAAGARTRVLAALGEASQGQRALGGDGTFGATRGRRANHAGHARAGRRIRHHAALAVGAAWRWITRVHWRFCK